MRKLLAWLRQEADLVSTRIIALHIIAIIGALLLAYVGVLLPILQNGGVFSYLIAGMVSAVVFYSVVAARRFEKTGDTVSARNAVSWLEWADGALMVLGFLGTLYGAIVELGSLNPSATGAALVDMLKSVIRGVGIAIYTTLAGAAAALWTSIATRMLSNTVETVSEVGVSLDCSISKAISDAELLDTLLSARGPAPRDGG